MKPVIGIIAPINKNSERPFKTYTSFVDNFPKRIMEAGGIPIGILFPEGKFNEDALKLCDGFLLQGGDHVQSTGINVINYALKNDKPVLGVCLGMQTMAGYEWMKKRLGDNPSYADIEEFYKEEYEDEYLDHVSSHNNENPFYIKNIEGSKHDVLLSEGSQISEIFKTNIVRMPSLHVQTLKKGVLSEDFLVTGVSRDGLIEVIENKNNFMIGVQFHPELEEKNLNIFKKLVEEAKNNMD